MQKIDRGCVQDRERPQLEYQGQCSSSYGELLQGMLPGAQHFLVTIPINIYSFATFSETSEPGIQVFPSSKKKTELFLNKVNDTFNLNLSGAVTVHSQIPEGKGLSSSTADLVATLRAVENYLGVEFPKETAGQILSTVEPSDGLLYPNSVAYNHRKCSLIKTLGNLPRLSIISIDDGGMIDTMCYNCQSKRFSQTDQALYANLLDEISAAFIKQDMKAIGAIATQSALLNQRFNLKPDLDQTIQIAEHIGAYGVINTHSGTCLGILIDPARCDIFETAKEIKKIYPQKTIAIYQTI